MKSLKTFLAWDICSVDPEKSYLKLSFVPTDHIVLFSCNFSSLARVCDRLSLENSSSSEFSLSVSSVLHRSTSSISLSSHAEEYRCIESISSGDRSSFGLLLMPSKSSTSSSFSCRSCIFLSSASDRRLLSSIRQAARHLRLVMKTFMRLKAFFCYGAVILPLCNFVSCSISVSLRRTIKSWLQYTVYFHLKYGSI